MFVRKVLDAERMTAFESQFQHQSRLISLKTCRNFSRNATFRSPILLMINANGCSMWPRNENPNMWCSEHPARFLFTNTHFNDETMNDKSLIIFFRVDLMLSLWHKIIWKFDVILNVSLFGSLSHTQKEDSINLSACVFDVKKLNMHRFGRHTSQEWSHFRTAGGIFQDPYSPNGNRNQKSLTPANHNCWLKQISIMFEINWNKFNKKTLIYWNLLRFTLTCLMFYQLID